MKPYRILRGDAAAVLKTLPAESFDGAFCDPPYGLSFMNKAWDAGVPPAATWAEVLRVLKPGAPLLAFGGTRTYHRLACAIEDAGFLLTDTLCWLHGQGFPKGKAQLKPAWEPITLAWKKGKRALAIDAGRIETADKLGGGAQKRRTSNGNGWERPWMADPEKQRKRAAETNAHVAKAECLGRWPANVLLDEEAAAALDAQSGDLGLSKKGSNSGTVRGAFGLVNTKNANGAMGYGDSGGASRFFYCAKASRKERGEGNTHPTVKPLKLCEYLAKLILPVDPEAQLLIPFSGSGSEMLGARKAGWKRITGIELNAEYIEIAAKRLEGTPLRKAA